MKVDLCNVCFKETRKVKYVRERGNICQWCVTTIINNSSSPSEIKRSVFYSIKSNIKEAIENGEYSLSLRPVAPLKPIGSDLIKNAEKIQSNENGFLDFVYRFFKVKYNNQFQFIFNELVDVHTDRYNQKLECYALKLEDFNTKRIFAIDSAKMSFRKFYHVDFMLQMLKNINEYLLFESEFFKFSVYFSKENEIIYRSYLRGYISSDGNKIERLNEHDRKEMRVNVLMLDNRCCVICGAYGDIELHIHHIIPLANSGSNDKNNLVTLCYSCHNKQHGFKVTRNKKLIRSK